MMLFIDSITVANPQQYPIGAELLIKGEKYYVVGRIIPGNKILLLQECDKVIIEEEVVV